MIKFGRVFWHINHCRLFNAKSSLCILCRGVRPPHECPGYDTEQSDGEVPVISQVHSLGNVEYPFTAIAPRSTLARSGST